MGIEKRIVTEGSSNPMWVDEATMMGYMKCLVDIAVSALLKTKRAT